MNTSLETVVRPSLVLTLFFYSFTVVGQTDLTSQQVQWKTFLENSGDIVMFSLPMIAASSTLIFEDDREGTLQWLKSFGTSIAVTTALKYTIDKPRPAGNPNGLAFPSGHTSTAFNSAAFIQKRYGWKYGAPAYALAGYVAYSRLEGIDGSHDGWDVVGGMTIGIGSAYLFTRPLDNNKQISLVPLGQGFNLTYTF